MTDTYLTNGYLFPVPALKIKLSGPAEHKLIGPFQAIVDTGADMSVLPTSLILRLKLNPIATGQLRSQWGELHPITFYLLDLQVDQLVLPNVQVAGDDTAEEILVGRNVLNKLALLLDGPEQQTDLLDAATMKRLRARRA